MNRVPARHARRPVYGRWVLALTALIVLLLSGCEFTLPAPVVAAPPGGSLTVAFLDVGQGDAILIRGPSGMTMLVDGGRDSDAAARVVLPALRAWGTRQLDLLVVTHPDEDHIGGLPAVLQAMPVQNVALTGQIHTTHTYTRLLEEVRDRHMHAIRTRAGMTLPFDPAVQVQVLNPGDAVVQSDDTNDASIVVKVVFGQVSFLLTGDAEMDANHAMEARGADLRATVLKVGHHGSVTSTDDALLQRVNPQIAVISVGADNPYGHPHREVLAALARRSLQVYRTDRNGTITITTDGVALTVKTER